MSSSLTVDVRNSFLLDTVSIRYLETKATLKVINSSDNVELTAEPVSKIRFKGCF